MYLVICYDVKNQTVDTIDKFDSFEEAQKYIEADSAMYISRRSSAIHSLRKILR